MGDLKYGEFEFPSDRGFSGSAGKTNVKGYMRGGHVKGKRGRSGKTVGVTTEPGPRSRRPKANMTKAAKGGSIHDKMYEAGGDMGFARGGQVKDTSNEFVQRSAAQDSMDSGTFPPGSANQAEKEAGGRKRTKPRFKKGGKAKVAQVRSKPLKTARGTGGVKKAGMRRKASGKNMPKNVKAKGGLARYAEGGNVSPPSVGHLGEGAAAESARRMRRREERIDATAQEAITAFRNSTQRGTATHDRPPKKAAAKPKSDRIYREDKDGVPTFTDVPKTGSPVKRARGGGVKKSEVRRIAKDVADDTMDRHVRAPRPRGHGTRPRGGRSRVRGGGY